MWEYMQGSRGCGRALTEAVLSCHRKLVTTLVDIMRASAHCADDVILVMHILTAAIEASGASTVAEAGLLELLDEYLRGDSGAKAFAKDARYCFVVILEQRVLICFPGCVAVLAAWYVCKWEAHRQRFCLCYTVCVCDVQAHGLCAS
jgi:hypothetical protein